jgi:hypothetical protein
LLAMSLKVMCRMWAVLSSKSLQYQKVPFFHFVYVIFQFLAKSNFRRLASDCRSAMPGGNGSFFCESAWTLSRTLQTHRCTNKHHGMVGCVYSIFVGVPHENCCLGWHAGPRIWYSGSGLIPLILHLCNPSILKSRQAILANKQQ